MAGDNRYDTLLYHTDGPVAVVTLNRPERMNAWNATMAAELSAAMTRANEDDSVRAVVLTGAGRAFCAGADLERGGDTFSNRDRTERAPAAAPVYPYMIDKPVIAAINGSAVGVGMTYPMLCDMRLVAEDAKLGFVFTRRGMMPELGAHLLVQRVAGFSRAADLLLSGRIVRGGEAAALGLASESLPREQVLSRALELAGEYRLTAPVSVAVTKRLLWEGLHTGYDAMRAREDRLFAWLGNQPDAREGIQSFVEKREPAWSMSVTRNRPDLL
ncbi:MAG: enoyl-CoA hydratase-related protein [Pseudomonadales bacterium]